MLVFSQFVFTAENPLEEKVSSHLGTSQHDGQTGLLFGGLCSICCFAWGVCGYRAIPVFEENPGSLQRG